MPTVRVLLDLPMQLGECPVWSAEECALYWIDIAGQAVHRFSIAHSEHRFWKLPSEPGAIARSANGGLIVAMRTGLVLMDTNSGTMTNVAPPPYDPSVSRFNDGRCDAAGRFWTGSLYEPKDKPAGDLYCVERGHIRRIGNPVTVSNGVAFSPDNQTLYHADTTAHRITAYDFDLTTGTISSPRLFMQFSADRSSGYGGRPDGAAVDSEGAYWCAMYEGGKLVRICPQGRILQEISLPVRCPTMPAFGGHDMRTLFITSARHNRSEEELKTHPLSGCVLSIRVDVAGRSDPVYIS
jgi:sugar lactone lactonase YvrE